MKAPWELRSAADEEDEITITHREYEEENVVVVDFGPSVDASVDFVGETAIVVAGDRQFEFQVPEGVTEITTNDGILLITGRAESGE